MEKILFYVIIAVFSTAQLGQSAPPTSIASPDRPVLENADKKILNKTIAQLVQQQTDTIKKIVSDQQTRLDYPVITKYDALYSEEAKKEIEKLTLEELKIRCQHLSKLLNTNKTDNIPTSQKINDRIDNLNTGTKVPSHKPYNFQKRPVYIQPKPSFGTKYSTTHKTNGFYITTQSTTTSKPSVPPTPVPQNIKYIRLEPVILQKTILHDGRTIYYWHKSLPSAVQYPVSQNIAELPNNNNKPEATTEPLKYQPAPTPTTATYNSYDFRNFFPSFYGSSNQETSTTEKSTTSTTTATTTAPTTEKNDELLYTQQLRFVVPVPYDNPEQVNIKHPWEFDQFAYYPKQLQPSSINVQVPYSPQFHMIKTLAVPNNFEHAGNKENDNIDNVEFFESL